MHSVDKRIHTSNVLEEPQAQRGGVAVRRKHTVRGYHPRVVPLIFALHLAP
jgi:hypothetical protein